MVAQLLQHGVDVHAAEDEIGATAIVVASRRGHAEVVASLLGAGASSDTCCVNGTTALYHVAQAARKEQPVDGCVRVHEGHLRCVELLLNSGSRPDAPCAGGMTPLKMAAKRGHRDMMALMLKALTTSTSTALAAADKLHSDHSSDATSSAASTVDSEEGNEVTS